MAKAQKIYVCDQCGGEQSRWQGQCTHCGEWNTLAELNRAARPKPELRAAPGGARSWVDAQVPLQELGTIEAASDVRLASGIAEFDRVLGGGLVAGEAALLGGQPGAGKSTLLLQLAERLPKPTLYVSGEESPQQLAMRSRRLEIDGAGVHLLASTDVARVLEEAERLDPKLIVIDSIQVMQDPQVGSMPGGVAQVRECGARLVNHAKRTGAAMILIGHMTKDGALAGPRVLEHMVDCSLLLDESDDGRFRTLRARKNRFGPIGELGVFAMTDRGLREVRNPSAIFLSRGHAAAGSLVTVLWEGSRGLLVEIQALVDSACASGRRLAVGLGDDRLMMLLAVLNRHGGLSVGAQDVFANAVGGVRVAETGADLPLLLAAASSLRDRPLPTEMISFGEVGLSGEIRPVPAGLERLRAAAQHDFSKAVIPKANAPKKPVAGMEVIAVGSIAEALDACGLN